MKYEDVVRDFARRTLLNLRTIEAARAQGAPGAFETTQLINSTLGLLVLPRERYIDHIPETPLDELEAKGWPIPKVVGDFPNVAHLRQLITKLRHAVAHFNLEFPSDGTDEIRLLRVWNTDPRSKQTTWKAEFSATDLRLLVERFAELLLENR